MHYEYELIQQKNITKGELKLHNSKKRNPKNCRLFHLNFLINLAKTRRNQQQCSVKKFS